MSQMDRRRIRDIFLQSQHSATSHEKLCKQMRHLYEKISEEDFLSEFTNCLKVPFVHGEKHSVVENTLNFAAKFTVSLLPSKVVKPASTSDDEEDEEMCPFLLNIFKFLFENHNTEHQAIRFRVCQFVNKLLNGLGNEACIDDNLCDNISECMMERLQDKAPMVRVQALMALHRLQDPTDPNCAVMKAFMFHMSSDPSADVRRAVITNIAITAQSVRSILERTHDIKDVVRRTAYISLSKLSVQRFTINQRVRLLTDGLKDHSEIVRNCVSKIMLPSWLQYYKGNMLSLLHALDCENSTEISSLALETLFKTEQLRNVLDQLTKILNKDVVIPTDELTPENSLYWRVLFEYLEAHPEIADERPIDEPLPEILPELTTFCNYIRKFHSEKSVKEVEHWVKLQHQYILQQLLELSKGFDLSDEMGRANLRQLCLDLLTSERVSEDVVPTLVEVMVKVVPDVEDRLQALAEVISEVREPMVEQESLPEPPAQLPPEEARQLQLKQAMIRVKINEKKEEQDEAIKEQDFLRAQQMKEEWQNLQIELEALAEQHKPAEPVVQERVRDVVKDRAALCKCLRIVCEMVQSDTVKSLTATLRSLLHNFVLPCLQEDNSIIIRGKALEALGLFSLLDQELAKENFVMFCFQIANDEVCEVALKVTFDLLHLYGLEAFRVEEDEDGNLRDKKKSKKKKKNLFVTDMYDDEFEDDEESQENLSQPSNGSSANTANLIAMLTSLLDSASTSMRNLAMEGLYKLLMACRITSSALLSRLVLMWYSPVTEGDESLRQPLGVFLTVYASHCPRSQETLEQAFLPTMRTLMQAPIVSPLSQVDQDSVARLFISLTRPGSNKYHAKNTHIHNNMAISLCNEILNADDDSTNISCFLRALLQLELSLEDPVYHDELKTLVDNLVQTFHKSREKQYLRYTDRFRQMIDLIETTMQSSVVNNTAVTDELGGTQSQSVNSTSSTVVDNTAKKGKRYVLLSSSHPRSESVEDQVDDDDDDADSIESPGIPPCSIIIPPSPPSSQDDDVFEDIADDKQSSNQHGDDIFKQPLQPKRRGRTKKPSRSSENSEKDNQHIKSTETSSPRSTRRIAQVSQLQEKEAVNARHTDFVNSPKSQKGNKAKSVNTAESEGNEKNVDKQSKVGEQNKNVTAADTRKEDNHNSDSAVSPNSSRPKREIHPTERGATLKTFQKNADASSSPKSIEASRQSPQSNSSQSQTNFSSEGSTPEHPAEKRQKLSENSRKRTAPAASRSAKEDLSKIACERETRTVRVTRHNRDVNSSPVRQAGGKIVKPSQQGGVRNKQSGKRGPILKTQGPSNTDSNTNTSSSSSVSSLRRRNKSSTGDESPASPKQQLRHDSAGRTRSSVGAHCHSQEELKSPSPTKYMVNYKSSEMSSPSPLHTKSGASSVESSPVPSSRHLRTKASIEDSSPAPSSRRLRSEASSVESSPAPTSRRIQTESSSVESSPIFFPRNLRSGTSSAESSPIVSSRSLRSGKSSVESSPARLPKAKGKVSSSDDSPAINTRRKLVAESSPAANTRHGHTQTTSSDSSPALKKKTRGSKGAATPLSSSDSTPPRTRRSVNETARQGSKNQAKLPRELPKSKDQGVTADLSPIPLRRGGRLSRKGKDTTDDEASPIQPLKKPRIKEHNKESPSLRSVKSARTSLIAAASNTVTMSTRNRIQSDTGVKTRRK